MNDDLIIQKFITDKNKINSHYKQIINKNQEIKEYLDNRYKDGNNNYCETLYRIQYHIEKRPVCPNCGKYVKFISGTGYRGYCSVSCSKNYIKEDNNLIITDYTIKNDYLLNGELNTKNKLQIKYIKEHGYELYLLNRYNDSQNFGEVIYRICNNIDNIPKCKECGKPVRFLNLSDGYDDVCSDRCKSISLLPEITDDYIKSLDKKGGLFKNIWYGHDKIEQYLKNKFKDEYRSYDEAIYMVLMNMHKIPRCPVCGNYVKFEKNRYEHKFMKYCSIECQSIGRRTKTINKIKKLTGFNIELTNSNQYKFINVCDIHKEFILTHDQFHNRCSSTRYMYGVLCPICNPERNPQTSIETIMKDILDNLNIEYIQHDRKLIGPKELDFYLNNYKIAIECNGIYWHSLQKKDKDYHINKFNICRDKGIQLISFWEYDIKHNESFITNILKIYSNNIEHNYTDNFNYEIKCIDNKEYRDFVNSYSLHRNNKRVNLKLGLYIENKLIYTFGLNENKTNIHILKIVSRFNYYIKDVVKYIIDYLDTDKDIIIDVNNDIGDIYNITKYCCYYKNIDSYEDFVIRKDDTALAKKNDKFVVRCYNSGIIEYKVKLL